MPRQLRPVEPIDTVPLFRPLHRELIALLRGLDREDWERPTAAGSWRVREVAAHLLHGDLRELSAERERGTADPVPDLAFSDLVQLIDADNADGVRFLSRLGTRLITDLLEVTGRWVASAFAARPPHGRAAANVAWAGERVSENRMDVGREFTERWHHQMQIRDAVGAPPLTGRRWVAPLLNLSVLAMRRAYRDVDAAPGTAVVLEVHGDRRQAWSVVRGAPGWEVVHGAVRGARAVLRMDADAAWRSLYDFASIAETRRSASMTGDLALLEPMLRARSVMIPSA